MGISGQEFSEALTLRYFDEPTDADLSAIEHGESLDAGDAAEMQDVYAVPRENSLRDKPAKSGHTVINSADPSLKPKLEENWQDGANCLGVDPDIFFPERGASVVEAKKVCRGCVVKEQCLEFALQNSEKFGIWGGLSERQRRTIRHQRSQSARSVIGA